VSALRDGGQSCILVLGMHRSGTSALTRVINLLGAALPQNLMQAAPNNNEAGFWEPQHLWTLHDQMLGEAGSRWDDWRKLDLSGLPPDRLMHYKAEIVRQIAEEYGDAQLIVLKEPRICRFARFFTGLLAELGYKCRYLLALRNPLGVIASLAHRDGMSKGFAALLWLRHVLDAEAATRAMPRAIVSYDALLADWQTTVQILSTHLDVEWPRTFGEVRGEIEKFLSNELRHFAPSLRDLQARGDISAWVRDAYEALLRVERNPDDMPAYSVLDCVRDEFEAASQAFSAAIFTELAERERKLEVERGRLAEEYRATLAAKDNQLAALAAEMNEAARTRNAEIAALRNRIEDLDHAAHALVPQTPQVIRPMEIDHSLAVPITHLIVQPPLDARTAVIIHLFYEELAGEFRRYVENIPGQVDVFISTCCDLNKRIIEAVFSDWPNGRIDVRAIPNRGRDIAPKLVAFKDIYHAYEIVLHLHSKCSTHAPELHAWRHFLLENMLGTREVASTVLQLFATMPSLGIVASQHFEPIRRHLGWGPNFSIAQGLASRMGIELSEDRVLDFPSGSMFWARSAALKPLLDLGLDLDDFPLESGQNDGTLAHAIERLYFHVCERAGYDWIKISRPDLFEKTPAIVKLKTPTELVHFIADFGLRLTGDHTPVPSK
jgi:hypothetical protein